MNLWLIVRFNSCWVIICCVASCCGAQVLGQRTEGFSGSDIATVVKDVLMQPIRLLRDATHFRKVNPPPPEAAEGPTATPMSQHSTAVNASIACSSTILNISVYY
jgi:SpoVK/Ycf46/Vps4 family AAA+-type ATPase